MPRKMIHEGRVIRVTGHDRFGRAVILKEVTVLCKRCTLPFTCVMTTKPLAICEKCAVEHREELRLRANAREAKKRRERRASPPSEPAPRKIPFAGYDPEENLDA
jgi:hypothetical protein